MSCCLEQPELDLTIEHCKDVPQPSVDVLFCCHVDNCVNTVFELNGMS